MAWTIKYDSKVLKDLKKLDKPITKQIIDYLEHLRQNDNPRQMGKALQGNLKKYWRYRVGDYRIICYIEDDIIQILVLGIGHRKEVYKYVN
ncbi:MAG: hypothetical protein RLZZ210_216 [Pseudomonadota bacterium]